MDNTEVKQDGSAVDLFLVKLAGKYSKYKPGDVIYSEGDMGNTMLFILSGNVRIVKLCSETNQPLTLATRGVGEFIGEMALVEESPRSASVIAKTACKVLEITKRKFEKIIKEKPSFALNVLESLSNKLRESDSSRVLDLEKNNHELSTANEKLLGLNSFLDSIIDQSPSAILLVTKAGDISKMNKSALGIFGLNKDKKYNINDLFSNFKFSDCQQDLQTTWSGKVNGLRVGQEFPAFVTCTVLTTFREELLYLVMGQDLTEISGFTSVKATEDRYVSARQSAYELAIQLSTELDHLKNHLNHLSHDISVNKKDAIKRSQELVMGAISELKHVTGQVVVSNDIESHFAFVEIRVLMKTILKYWQTIDEYASIDFSLEVRKNFPGRVHIKEVALQNALISLINVASIALVRDNSSDKYTLKVELGRSPDQRYSEIRIIPHLIHLEPDDIIDLLNRNSIFDWNYIEQVIHHHEGEFLITNNDDNYPVIIIRLP